jgi:hypothetical protein
MLVPMVIPGPPAIDGLIVPTVTAAQWAVVPHAWATNLHRTGTNGTAGSGMAPSTQVTA